MIMTKTVRSIFALVIFIVGALLFYDEVWMFGLPYGHILPDLSFLHVGPIHHWMWGLLMMIVSLLYLVKISREDSL
jgi:hypothetical protein